MISSGCYRDPPGIKGASEKVRHIFEDFKEKMINHFEEIVESLMRIKDFVK